MKFNYCVLVIRICTFLFVDFLVFNKITLKKLFLFYLLIFSQKVEPLFLKIPFFGLEVIKNIDYVK